MKRLLLVDDEQNVLHALVRTLRSCYRDQVAFETFTNPFEALKRCSLAEFDVVISDFRMLELTGVEFLAALQQVAPDTVRIMLTASTEFGTVSSAINEAGVFRFLSKPWDETSLRAALDASFEQREKLVQERDERSLLGVKR